MGLSINVNMTDADMAAYKAIVPADTSPAATVQAASDRQTFIVAKLAAQEATTLETSLAKSNIIAMLSPADQAALGGLIAAVKASQ